MNDSDFEIENHVLKKYQGKGSGVVSKERVNISIPQGVTEIGRSAFLCCGGIESVEIPDGVVSIGESAFYACENLKSVTLPESLRKIELCAFDQCRKLKYFQIPDSVSPENIGWNEFRAISSSPESYPDGCMIHQNILIQYTGNVREITIPPEVREIRNDVRLCHMAESVVIPETVEKMTMRLFEDSENLKCVSICGMKVNLKMPGFQSAFALFRAVRNFMNHQEKPQDLQFLKENSELLLWLEAQPFQELLNTGEFFTPETIDTAILKANQYQCYENQMLLTDYKYQHVDFNQTGENLKL